MNNIEAIELNITDKCNRTCIFCPHSFLSEFSIKNTIHNEMSIYTFDNIYDRLKEYNFLGMVSFSGFGEPLMCSNLKYGLQKISSLFKTRLITNGDFLTEELLLFFKKINLHTLKISIHDNLAQYNKICSILKNINYTGIVYINRTYEENNIFFNRGGSVNVDSGFTDNINRICTVTTKKIIIDWNGNFLLCFGDWKRTSNIAKQKMNIVNISFSQYLNSIHYISFIEEMYNNKRKNLIPCKFCNIYGIERIV